MSKYVGREIPLVCERLPRLRLEIRSQQISFPAQIPLFPRENRPDVQWRMAVLYFVHGWSCEWISRRYEVTPGRVRQAIRRWVERAESLGYLQRIPSETAVPVNPTRPALSISHAVPASLPLGPAGVTHAGSDWLHKNT